jgi:hypothetical protein
MVDQGPPSIRQTTRIEQIAAIVSAAILGRLYATAAETPRAKHGIMSGSHDSASLCVYTMASGRGPRSTAA